MADLICDNYPVLILMNRFGISLGVEKKSIEEVCYSHGVDVNTFLSVTNLMLHHTDHSYRPVTEGLSVVELIKFLHSSHEYYYFDRLQWIRSRLIEFLEKGKISNLIIQYFDDYVLQIREHFRYEEELLFPYVLKLMKGEATGDFSIATFEEKHDHIEEPLNEFKDVIIKYYNGSNSLSVTHIIHDLLQCANDLLVHNKFEDLILVPIAKQLELDKYGSK